MEGYVAHDEHVQQSIHDSMLFLLFGDNNHRGTQSALFLCLPLEAGGARIFFLQLAYFVML